MVTLAFVGADEAERAAWAAAAARLPEVGIVAVATDELPSADCHGVVIGASADHASAAVSAAAHSRKHVLVDLAALGGVAALEAVSAVCRKNQVVCRVATPRRFLPAVQAVKKSLESGQLGAAGLLRIHRWLPRTAHGAFGMLAAEIDLAVWLFGHPPDSVYAVSRDEAGGYVQVHLGFPDGAMALIDVAATLPAGDDYYSLSLIGAAGAAYADDHHNMHLLYRGGRPAAMRSEQTTVHRTAVLREFVAAIQIGREAALLLTSFPLPPGEGRVRGTAAVEAALRAADAARRAIETGRALWLASQGDGYELG
jgi:predicted dehydrogenase